MAGPEKKVIERNAHGENVLTPYGEFLSYYHTHIQLFGTLISAKKISPKDQEALKSKIRSYISSNIQKTDHFFDQLPQFAQFLGMSAQELSSYMNRNFLGALNKVKSKLIEQESALESTPRKKKFAKISEEILDGLGFKFPEGHRFEQEEGIIYLVEIATGKKREAQGLAEAAREGQQAAVAAKPIAAPVRKGPETPILSEILAKYGELFSGKPLILQAEELEEDDTPVQMGEEILSDVDDLHFDGDFGFDDSPAPVEPPVNIPFSKYMDQVNKVRAYQKGGQLDEYKRWVASLPVEENALVQLQAFLLKESKGEVVEWDGTLGQLGSRTGLSESRLRKVLELGRDYFRIRTQLEASWNKARTASPAVSELVKKAWPHILRVMDEYPDFVLLKGKMDQLLSRIPDSSQRKILSDLFLNPVLSIRKN
ncbi:hypothetical protein EHQ27_07270 [Leptospira wolffii]|uniref:Uncharacterized protein n=1 Tax=Leptospira wolffii TaxID=409998 RepID=A0A2M9ZB18_9LEPT|nr:hypothetical protein [Leptospira wolffii]PJZ65608.1 hypothetical protein CH371_11790 [Leptospira wolffii]TGK56183.1 hypothetical protein EHQ32_17375 [Leptospira wolffii]TGK72229.1 hypothetical protein EHQ35_12810 [Leptospira wolffii]TGK72864.1 hypothetical protein EHQ27_07270 [Leptospira wolffii]TGL27806.1 hypothetical protein EHQ57_15635 [Leptospira wolffii]